MAVEAPEYCKIQGHAFIGNSATGDCRHFEADQGAECGWPLEEHEVAGEFACAECGTTTATTYVVTTLDYSDPKSTRTEVCLDCHNTLKEG